MQSSVICQSYKQHRMFGALTSNLEGVRLVMLTRPQLHTFRVCSDSIKNNHERSFPRDRLVVGKSQQPGNLSGICIYFSYVIGVEQRQSHTSSGIRQALACLLPKQPPTTIQDRETYSWPRHLSSKEGCRAIPPSKDWMKGYGLEGFGQELIFMSSTSTCS